MIFQKGIQFLNSKIVKIPIQQTNINYNYKIKKNLDQDTYTTNINYNYKIIKLKKIERNIKEKINSS